MKRAWLFLILALIGTVGPATADEAADDRRQPVDVARRYVDAFVAGDMQTLLDHASPALKKLMKDAANLAALREQSVGSDAESADEEISVIYNRRVKAASGQAFAILAQVAPDGQLVAFSIQPAGASATQQAAPRKSKQAGDASAKVPEASPLAVILERSPFAAVRWQQSQPEVQVGDEWFKLVSLDGLPASEIVAFSRRSYGDRWQMRFEEDLVQLLTNLGHPPQDKVTLVVQSLKTPETQTLTDVAMTHANRRAIKAAALARKLGEPANGQEAKPEPGAVDAKVRRRLVGRYQLAPDFIFDVRDRDGHLMVGITNQETQEVYADSPTRWSYRGIEATLEFELPKTGPAKSLVLHQNGLDQTARRIK